MSEQEGVIRYRLAFSQVPAEPLDGLDELIAWRRMLRLLGLLGQEPARYGGFGFGNVSRRLEGGRANRPRFVITGTQTGHLTDLGPEHFAVVTGWNIGQNGLEARGPARPSSESLTHAAIYEVSRDTQCVMHVHSPEIWRSARSLALPTTPLAATCGTPRMAEEVQQVVRSKPGHRVLVMLGHEDGVIAWGESAEAAGLALVAILAHAFRLEA